MFRSKKKSAPTPENCKLQRVDLTVVSKDRVVTNLVPDKSSSAYSQTLVENRGVFFRDTYKAKSGTWLEESKTVTNKSFIGTFTCRRTIAEQRASISVERANEIAANDSVYETVNQLGICATCPYVGMTTIEADQYDAVAQTAEAAKIRSDIQLAAARQELAQFLESSNLHQLGEGQ